MIQILALSTSYPLRPDDVAGIFVHNLYRALSNTYAIEVLCPDSALDSGGSIDGITVTPVRYAPKRFQLLGGAGGIMPSLKARPIKLLLLPLLLLSLFGYTLYKARQVRLIHANWAICGVIAGVAGKLLDRKVVLTLRGSDVEKSRGSVIFKWQLQLALVGADSVVCVSKAMMNDLVSMYPKHAQKISYCNNGISDIFFKTIRMQRKSREALQILAVGGLIPVKGFDLLVDAIHRLSIGTNLFVTIVGAGPDRDNLQSLISSYGLESKISLKGEAVYADMPDIMANSDIFILSSRAEGRPNVVAEAVASGLPVISADLPGVQDLVIDGMNGWLFKAGDSIALSKAVRHAVLNRESLFAMGESGRQMIRKNSAWSVTADYYGTIFNKLVDDYIE